MLDYLGIVLTARIRSERGASAVEYGLLVAGVAMLLIVAAKALGFTLGAILSQQTSDLGTPN